MRKSVIGISIIVTMLCLVAGGMRLYPGGKEEEMEAVSTEREIEESGEELEVESSEEKVEESSVEDLVIKEEEEPTVKESRFGYMLGSEYDEDKIPRRFGYVVEEEFEEREVPLKEEDFKQLRKGEYFNPLESQVGMFDGQIMYEKRSPGSGFAHTSPYYKLDDNTYVVLFYENNIFLYPLERVEVWDGEGNKLREIELD